MHDFNKTVEGIDDWGEVRDHLKFTPFRLFLPSPASLGFRNICTGMNSTAGEPSRHDRGSCFKIFQPAIPKGVE